MDTLKVTLDLTVGGVKNVRILTDNPEQREVCLQRLLRVMPILELLESELQKESTEPLAESLSV